MAEEPCPKCGGSTWIVIERDGITGAERCECFGVRRNAEREARAGIPPNYANATLENFQLPSGQSGRPAGALRRFHGGAPICEGIPADR